MSNPYTPPPDAPPAPGAEQALGDSASFLEQALAVGQLGAWRSEPDSGALWWSPETYRIFGLEPGTPVDIETFFSLVHPEDRERVRAADAAVAARGDAYEVEHRIVRPDGVEKWVRERARVQAATATTPLRLVGVVQDITDAREVEEALRASRTRLQDIVQHMPVLMLAVDHEARVVFWNLECERVTGYTAGEVLADPAFFATLFPNPADRARIAPRPGERTEFRDWEVTLTCKDGSTRTIAWSNSAAAFAVPEWAAWAIGVDVTERKRLEEQFLQSQKMEAIGRLAGGIAHDFNNLLTVVAGYTEVVLSELSSTHPHRPALEQVRRAGERAAALTRQLLLFTRRQVVEARVVDLNHVVRDMTRMLQRLIGEDLELQILTAKEPCPVKTDPGQIEQVLMNLAVNARDAMPGGGRLQIETGHFQVPAGQSDRRTGVPPGSWVFVRVTDNGSGMDAETLPHIFEPFFTTKAPGTGTGLGLATVFGIVRQNNGHIDVSSTRGVGSVFTIYLPRTDEPLSASGTHRVARVQPKGDETILLVEDDDDVRELAREGLVMRGYKVLDVRDGSEAFLLSQGYPGQIHLLVTDVVMPAMNGPQVAELLALHRPQLKVLFISGYTGDLPLKHTSGQPPTLLYKPFTIDVLARKVREVLDS